MSHTVIDSMIELDTSWLTVMCRATRFHITVSYKDIQRSRFATEYLEMVAKAMDDDDGEDYDVLCEWIVDPCLTYLREVTLDVPKNITFEDFYYPSTHHLKLLVSESSGHTRSWQYEHFSSDDTVRRPSTFHGGPSLEGIRSSNHFRYKIGLLYV